MTEASQPAILFVCLGNICRSPLAEAAFRAEAGRRELSALADSAGTGDWHIGNPPDPRAQAEALRHGIDISLYKARQVTARDFMTFTHVLALDTANLDDLRRLMPTDARAHLSLLMDMVPGREGTSVIDPYYGEPEGFEETWADVSAAARALVERFTR